jgi:hypothetical protein
MSVQGVYESLLPVARSIHHKPQGECPVLFCTRMSSHPRTLIKASLTWQVAILLRLVDCLLFELTCQISSLDQGIASPPQSFSPNKLPYGDITSRIFVIDEFHQAL